MSEELNEETTPESDPIADAILNAGRGGEDVPDAPVESGADVPDDEPVAADEESAEQELILGKFKSADDLIEAYKNLESHNTQVNQRLADLEAILSAEDEEEEPAPLWGVPFQNGEPQNEEELVGWAERDPGAAAQWALQNQARIPQETVNTLWEHWFERKPTEAMAWYTQQQTQTVAQQYEQRIAELQEQIAPLRDQQTQTMFESSMEALEQQIPDLADYADKIQAYIDDIPVDQLHLAFFPQGMDTPEKVQEGVKSLYAIVRMREAPMVQQQAAAQQASAAAFTQSRQGVVDTGPEDYDAKINAAILNG